MRNVVENEIYKSVHNRWFAISLLLAFIVQLFSFFPIWIMSGRQWSLLIPIWN